MATFTTQPRLRRKHRFNVQEGKIVVDNDSLAIGRSLKVTHRTTLSVADRSAPSKTDDSIYSPMKSDGYPYRLRTNRSIMLSSSGLLHIEDLYALIDGLQWVKDELEAWLPADLDAMAPQYLHSVKPISQIISTLLAVEDIFEYGTAEEYIESRTIDNFRDIPNTLATAEARIFNVLSLLADLEQCTRFRDIESYRELVGLKATTQIEVQNFDKIIDLKLKLVQSRLTRAEVRDYLQNLLSDLSTPRLAALRFRPHSDIQTPTEIAELPAPLPSDVTFVQAFIYQLENQLLTPPPTPRKHDADEYGKCLLCQHDANSDPKRAGHNSRPQLLTYTNMCCKSGPYHVVCMLCHIKTSHGSEAACPSCSGVLGKEYFMEVMERRWYELGMTREHHDTGRSEECDGGP